MVYMESPVISDLPIGGTLKSLRKFRISNSLFWKRRSPLVNLAFRVVIFLTLLSAPPLADSDLLTGNCVTPDHAVVTVYKCCEKTLRTKLIQVTDLAARDGKNPDRSLRNRPLCGL